MAETYVVEKEGSSYEEQSELSNPSQSPLKLLSVERVNTQANQSKPYPAGSVFKVLNI